jgi:recombination protein RecT
MAQSKQIMWVDQVNKGYDQMKSIYEGSNADYKAKQKAMIEYGFAKNAFRNNATLQKCDPISILESVVNIARTSLSLNPALRLAYLIPRKGKCTLEISYMGMIKLLRDSGAIQHIEAFIVFEDEDFEYNITDNKIKHVPIYAETEEEHNKRKVKGCYTKAVLPNGYISFCFMPLWELLKIKSESKNSGANSVWDKWRDEMYKKTVIKRHSKTLIAEPTPAIMAALDIENYNNGLKNLKKSSIYEAIDEGIEKNNSITENNAESMLLFEEE